MDWWEYLQGLRNNYFQGVQNTVNTALPNWWGQQSSRLTGRTGVGGKLDASAAVGKRLGVGGSAQPSPAGVGVGGGTGMGNVRQSSPPNWQTGAYNGNVGSIPVAGMDGGAGAGNGQGTGQTPVGQGLKSAAGLGVANMNGQQTGGQIVITPLQRGEKTLDNQLGEGWSKQFAAQHGGMSPIQFYGNAFQQIQDPEQRMGAAINAAINDANFQPGWIAEWQKVHGNVPPSQEAWEKAWWQAQNGGANFGQGAGINPWGVY